MTTTSQPPQTETGDPHFTPFTLIIDTREQMPFTFHGFTETTKKTRNKQPVNVTHDLIVKAKSQALCTGDYSIEGLEAEITIERKSLSDLIGTLTVDRERFKRELERMQHDSYQFTAVVVEASWQMLLHSDEYSMAVKKSVTRSVIAFQQRYRTQWMFAGSRREAERWTLRACERYWEDLDEERKEGLR